MVQKTTIDTSKMESINCSSYSFSFGILSAGRGSSAGQKTQVLQNCNQLDALLAQQAFLILKNSKQWTLLSQVAYKCL